jgi:RHS repeat-associated protein
VNGNCVVTDRLGSLRGIGTNESCGGWTHISYFPYGEEQTSTANGIEKFGTYFRDAVGQDYAQQRYYNLNTGRFWSVDPGGIRTAHLGNPTSWNRYAYVNGDPINFRDPMGLDCCYGDSDPTTSGNDVNSGCDVDQSGDIACSGGGGVDPTVAASNCTAANSAGCPSVLLTTTACSSGTVTYNLQGQPTCGDVPINQNAQATLSQTSSDLGFVQTGPNSYTQFTLTAGPSVLTAGVSVTVTGTGSVFVGPAVSAGLSTPVSASLVTGTVPQGTNVDDWAAGASYGTSYGSIFGYGLQWSATSSGFAMSYETGLYTPQAGANGGVNVCFAGPCLPPPPQPGRLGGR